MGGGEEGWVGVEDIVERRQTGTMNRKIEREQRVEVILDVTNWQTNVYIQ